MTIGDTGLIDIGDLDDHDRLQILTGLELWCAQALNAAKATKDKVGMMEEAGKLDGMVEGVTTELLEPGASKLRIRVGHLTPVKKGLELLAKDMEKTADKLHTLRHDTWEKALRGEASVVTGRLIPFFSDQTALPLSSPTETTDPWEEDEQ